MITKEQVAALEQWIDPEVGGTLPLHHRNAVQALLKERKERERALAGLSDTLDEVDEFLDEYADADHNGASYVPNKPMRLRGELASLRRLLGIEMEE